MFQFPDVIDVMATQQHYSQAELKIRRQPEYEKLKKALKKSEQVTTWKQDCLEIQIYSERIKGSIRQIKEPICFDDCKDVIIDLYDMFLNKEQEACKKCQKKPTSSNIKANPFIKMFLYKISQKNFRLNVKIKVFLNFFYEKNTIIYFIINLLNIYHLDYCQDIYHILALKQFMQFLADNNIFELNIFSGAS